MAERMPMLPALRAFEAVARLGSVRAAAAELHVTPAAVSQQVKALEADLGLQLIRRRGNALELTAPAQAGSETLSAGFRLMAEAVRRIRDHQARPQIRLSIDPTLAASWLIARLPRYRALSGSVDLLLDANRAYADFGRDRIDAAIRFGIGRFPGLDVHFLLAEELFPVCSPKLLQGSHTLKRPADLRHHTLLHNDWSSRQGKWPNWQDWLDAAGATGVDSKGGLHFNDGLVVLEAALDGQGVYLANTTAVQDLIAAGKLVAPFPVRVRSDLGYYFVCPEHAAGRREIATLRDWLLGEAAADRAAGQGAGRV
ncbi:transcriptional regulator GcvA [Dongia sp.]|uniref:transcriptional regulator GcvA n=1 Tax=Dongia sp. TaxID=1977262 RepID=UPI0035AFCC39